MTVDRLAQIAGTGRKAERFAALPEAERIAKVKAAGSVPDACGPEISPAPARGGVQAVNFVMLYPDGEGGYKPQAAGFQGRKALRVTDAFDAMAVAAIKAGGRPAFNAGQVAIARHYAALHERHACAGVKCSSLEAQGGGSGNGGFMDAVIADAQELAALRARIGGGIAKPVRRQRPTVTGSRKAIFDRALVDQVCLEGRTIGEVMQAHGWACKGQLRGLLQKALANALDRMRRAHSGAGIVSTTEGPLKKTLDA